MKRYDRVYLTAKSRADAFRYEADIAANRQVWLAIRATPRSRERVGRVIDVYIPEDHDGGPLLWLDYGPGGRWPEEAVPEWCRTQPDARQGPERPEEDK